MLFGNAKVIKGGGLIDETRDRGGHRLRQVLESCCLLRASSKKMSWSRWLWIAAIRCGFTVTEGFQHRRGLI